MKFEEIITDRLILRKFTQESFDFIYSDMSQDEQLVILGLNSIEKLLEEKEKYKSYPVTALNIRGEEERVGDFVFRDGQVKFFPNNEPQEGPVLERVFQGLYGLFRLPQREL